LKATIFGGTLIETRCQEKKRHSRRGGDKARIIGITIVTRGFKYCKRQESDLAPRRDGGNNRQRCQRPGEMLPQPKPLPQQHNNSTTAPARVACLARALGALHAPGHLLSSLIYVRGAQALKTRAAYLVVGYSLCGSSAWKGLSLSTLSRAKVTQSRD
jgi:hypothetical protein